MSVQKTSAVIVRCIVKLLHFLNVSYGERQTGKQLSLLRDQHFRELDEETDSAHISVMNMQLEPAAV